MQSYEHNQLLSHVHVTIKCYDINKTLAVSQESFDYYQLSTYVLDIIEKILVKTNLLQNVTLQLFFASQFLTKQLWFENKSAGHPSIGHIFTHFAVNSCFDEVKIVGKKMTTYNIAHKLYMPLPVVNAPHN